MAGIFGVWNAPVAITTARDSIWTPSLVVTLKLVPEVSRDRTAAQRGNDVTDRLAGLRSANPIVDDTWVIGIRQDPVSAVGRETGHFILQRKPPGLSPFGCGNNDQRPIAEGGKRGCLVEGPWQ